MKLKATYFLFLLLFSSLQTWAQNVSEIKKLDLNNDGKFDRFEHYQGEALIKIEEDRNLDQKMDYSEYFDRAPYYLVIEQDSNYDGKIDFRKSYLRHNPLKSKVFKEVDLNHDGVFESKLFEIVDDVQKNADCFKVVIESQLQKFAQTNLSVAEKIGPNFRKTGVGFKVEEDCYKKWGNDFGKIVKDSVQTGLQCLANLGAKEKSSLSGALRNGYNLSKLFKDDKISLVCAEDDYDWSGARAHASTRPDQQIKNKNVSHPYVSLNPSFPENPVGKRTDEIKQIKETIFHEALHNLGYRHSEGIEFSYGCGACCFDNTEAGPGKDIACKICAGNYRNELDENYLRDFIKFGKHNYKDSFAYDAVAKFTKLRAKNLQGLAFLANSSGSVFNPIGPELAKIIRTKHSNPNLERTIERELEGAETYSDMSDFATSKASTTHLSSALYELYYTHDSAKALAILSANKTQIKQEIEALEKDPGNKKYVGEELRRTLDGIIYDVWINRFPANAQAEINSKKAYELDGFFEKK